jgi:hypothetical protein
LLDLTSQFAPPVLSLLNEFLLLFAIQEASTLGSLCICHMVSMCMAAFIVMILAMGRVYWRGELDEYRMEVCCGLTSAVRTHTVAIRTATARQLTRFLTI